MTHTRRQFLKTAAGGAALLAGGGKLALAQENARTQQKNAAAGKNWQAVTVSDGTTMNLFIARPAEASGKIPGVILLQEIFGVNAYIRDVARRIADLGYVVAAPELFHRTAPGFESGYSDNAAGMAEMKKMTDETLAADLKATHDWLSKDPGTDAGHIGSVGFCMGGRASFLANAVLPLQAAVVYYGGGIADSLLDRAKDQHGPLLIFSGGRDTHIGREKQNAVAAALKAVGKSYVDIEFSEAEHGFFCDQRASYHPEAARESWQMATQFLKEHLKTDAQARRAPSI